MAISFHKQTLEKLPGKHQLKCAPRLRKSTYKGKYNYKEHERDLLMGTVVEVERWGSWVQLTLKVFDRSF